MRKSLLICFLLGSIAFAYSQPKGGKYAIKSGHVEYKLNGNTKGTKTLWWDNYGEKTYTEEKSVSVTKIFGMTSREETHLITVTVADKYWSANLLEKTGQKGTLPYYDLGHDIADGITEAEAKQLESEILATMGGKRLGTENILGYKCDVIEVMGVKSWIYKGVALKVNGTVLGYTTDDVATSFNKNCKVPASMFNPPKGVEYSDIDAQMQAYYEESDNQNEETDDGFYPLGYSYERFQTAISPLTQKGYINTMTENAEGQYVAVLMKGLMSGLSVIATSHKNMELKGDDISDFEKFTNNGHTCYFNNSGSEVILAIEYPKEDMIVLFAATANQTKEQLLKLANCCTF